MFTMCNADAALTHAEILRLRDATERYHAVIVQSSWATSTTEQN